MTTRLVTSRIGESANLFVLAQLRGPPGVYEPLPPEFEKFLSVHRDDLRAVRAQLLNGEIPRLDMDLEDFPIFH